MIYLKQMIFFVSFILLFQAYDIRVKQIHLFKNAEMLHCDIDVQEALDTKSYSTLTSGLPLRIILVSKIIDSSEKQLSLTQTEIIIEYDVWDEIFSVKYTDRIERFRALDSLKSGLRTFRNISLSPLQQLSFNQSYEVLLKIHLQNDSPGSLIDSIDHDPANKGFSLSAIIKFFFGSSEPRDHWYHSGNFTLNDLKSR